MYLGPSMSAPTLAQRAYELRALRFPGAKTRLVQGRELHFRFSISPTAFSREYHCLLAIPRAGFPEMCVLSPNLLTLSEGRSLPHIYRHDGDGTKLCLWLPRKNEWSSQMRLLETYIAWTSEWLNYFEEWLLTDHWAGGGEHPTEKKKRWR
ncbi:MAG: hypothetical protein K2Q97_16800 [Burkholderiaceae bacterium]|nr:hypothetical protein [Burkholderiaceae bacterium]